MNFFFSVRVGGSRLDMLGVEPLVSSVLVYARNTESG